MLNAIYASKLFRSSYRKDRIVSAFNNPLNKELVKQLSRYIPNAIDVDESSMSNESNIDETLQIKDREDDSKLDTAPEADKSVMHVNTISKSGDDNKTEDTTGMNKDADTTNTEDIDVSNLDIPDDTIENEDSKKSATSAIKNATQIVNNVYDSFMYIIDPIKSILNTHSDTSGVVRAAIKDNELWIYYNDNINLNNIMPNVIDILRAANYDYLEFNRLARSDNAIVFEIILSTTNNIG